MYTTTKDTSIYSVLTTPQFEKVFKSNVDEELSFGDWIQNMEKTLNEPDRAFFHIKSYVSNNEDYRCKVLMENSFTFLKKSRILFLCFQLELVWKSDHTLFIGSPAMKKKSPYYKFFRIALMDLVENGWLHRYDTKHLKSQADCATENIEGKSLGYYKIATLFYVLVFGFILSGVIFIFEFCLRTKYY